MIGGSLRLRSFMFLPACNRLFVDKALTSEADAIILDIEDSVPADRKQEARDTVVAYAKQGLLSQRKNVFVRINPIDTDDFIHDIEELTLKDVDGFMPSKIYSADDIVFLDGLLGFFERKKGIPEGSIKMTPLIETAKALENIREISVASDRLVALCLGGEDYLNDLGSVYTYQESALAYARMVLVNAARANGLLPIDTPYLDINDTAGFEEHELQAFKNGFAGCMILSPRQIELANKAFTPDAEKIELSRRIIEAVNLANKEKAAGVALLDGKMVGPPMRKKAENVLRQLGEL